MDAGKRNMNAGIERQKEELWQMADDIFDHPELGNQEVYASTLLEDWLESKGFAVERGLGSLPTAFRAVYTNGTGGPSIGLLCEYDALPGLGHACGHHLQGPCILAAANAVREAHLSQPFRLVVYGTPAEENMSGKLTMLREGCFQDVDLVLMMHGSPTTTCDVRSMANYQVDVCFTGKSAHAAISPEKGRSALDALLLTFQGVEFLREHVREDTRMHYTVSDTYGIPCNVVPDRAKGTFLLRSYNTYILEDVLRRFQNIVRGAELMTETAAEITISERTAAKIPVLRLNRLLMDCAEEVGAPRISEPRKKPGSTDLANVMEVVPGSCIRVAFVPPHAASHSQEFLDHGKTEDGHNAILYGAKILADASYELITHPELLREIQKEFRENKERMRQEV